MDLMWFFLKRIQIKMSSRFVAGCYTLMLVFASSCDFGSLQIITDESETFEGITEIQIRGGALETSYIGSDNTETVTLEAFLESSDNRIDGITYRRRGNRLEIEMGSDDGFGFWTGRTKGYIAVTGPRKISLDVRNASGTAEIRNVEHSSLDFRVSSGKMEVYNIVCENLNLKASSGKLHGENLHGDVDLNLSSGMATLKGVWGNVNFKGSSGSIKISEVEGIVEGVMSSGKASLEDVSEVGKLSIHSGMLTAEKVGLGTSTHLQASSGYMKVQTFTTLDDFNYDFSVGSGNLSIGDQSGSKNLKINNKASHTIAGSLKSGKMVLVN
jgi:lia operon protein LiaG